MGFDDQKSYDRETDGVLAQQGPLHDVNDYTQQPADANADTVGQGHAPVGQHHGYPRRPPVDGPFRQRHGRQQQGGQETAADDEHTVRLIYLIHKFA